MHIPGAERRLNLSRKSFLMNYSLHLSPGTSKAGNFPWESVTEDGNRGKIHLPGSSEMHISVWVRWNETYSVIWGPNSNSGVFRLLSADAPVAVLIFLLRWDSCAPALATPELQLCLSRFQRKLPLGWTCPWCMPSASQQDCDLLVVLQVLPWHQ